MFGLKKKFFWSLLSPPFQYYSSLNVTNFFMTYIGSSGGKTHYMVNQLCVLLSCDSSCSCMTSLGSNLFEGLQFNYWPLCFWRNVCFFFIHWEVFCVFSLKVPTSGCYLNAHLVPNQDAHLFPAILTICTFYHLRVIDG